MSSSRICADRPPDGVSPAAVSSEPRESQSPDTVPAARRKPSTRAACDRCHSQKLRCVRASALDSCQRCARLQTNCVFSPRSSRVSRQKKAINCRDKLPTIAAVGDAHEGPQIWSRLLPAAPPGTLIRDESGDAECLQTADFASVYGGLRTSLDQRSAGIYSQHALEQQHANNPGVAHISEFLFGQQRGLSFDTEPPLLGDDFRAYLGDSHPLCYPQSLPYELLPPSAVSRLAVLNLSIYDCAKKLHSIKKIDEEACDKTTSNRDDNQSREVTLFVLDELFQHTAELIDLMKSLSLDDNTGLGIAPSFPNGNMSRTWEPLPTDLRPLPLLHSNVGRFYHLDDATALILLSCLCQLADIYTSIFQLVQTCARGTLEPRTLSPRSGVLLPPLKIGTVTSFPALRVDVHTPIQPPALSMYLNIVTMAGSRLWAQVAELITGDACGNGVPRLSHVGMKWERAISVTSRLSDTIADTRQILKV